MLKYGFSGQCIKRSTSGFRAAPVLLPENTFVPQKETPKGFFLFSLFHHLHDLAASVDAINAAALPKGGVRIDNLVAAIEKGSRSFKILRERPDGKSYARDIADKYGLSLDKIMGKIQK